MSLSLIGHLDADCFYVSAERVRNPDLRGKPVAVLGNQGACVIAKSYEMKAAGVTTGMPIWDARKLCPDAIYVTRDFIWYEVLSRKMMEIAQWVSPCVEYYSIDEMFFDAAYLERTYKRTLRDAALALQQQILAKVKVPVSVGVSRSKILAKLASDAHKPFGCLVLLETEEIDALLRELPVTEITGIAERSRRRIEPYGIKTCLDFARADRRLIRRLLTKRGEDLWWELNGNPVIPILTSRPGHKALARGGSLGKATADPNRLNGFVIRNTERLIEALDFHHLYCEQLGMDLGFKDGTGSCYRFSLPEATADFRVLVPVAQQLLGVVWYNGKPVHYMHVIAERLCQRRQYQQGLFAQPHPKWAAVAKVKRVINQKHGRFVLRSAATLTLNDLYADPATSYDICDIYGKTCF